jgi:hypothetical protein
MILTAQQRAEIEQQRAADPATRSFRLTFTPEQRDAYRRAVAEEMAARDDNLRQVRQIEAAEREPTLSGTLRRAISASRRTPQDLSTELGIDTQQLHDFRAGVEPLPSDVIDRLIVLLDLEVIVADVTS